MTPAEEKRVRELTEEIAELKKHLTLKSAAMTNRDTSDELEKIGELLSEKNALTGLDEDAAYLYLDDGEWFREVKGFVGDDSGMHDCMGTALKIGDTVLFKNTGAYAMTEGIALFLSRDLPQILIKEEHGGLTCARAAQPVYPLNMPQ